MVYSYYSERFPELFYQFKKFKMEKHQSWNFLSTQKYLMLQEFVWNDLKWEQIFVCERQIWMENKIGNLNRISIKLISFLAIAVFPTTMKNKVNKILQTKRPICREKMKKKNGFVSFTNKKVNICIMTRKGNFNAKIEMENIH